MWVWFGYKDKDWLENDYGMYVYDIKYKSSF